jgi:DNA-binding beta-propeller fold protein YncE
MPDAGDNEVRRRLTLGNPDAYNGGNKLHACGLNQEATMNIRGLKRNHIVGGLLAVSIVGLGVGQFVLQNMAEAQRETVQAPMFEVDPFWPKPLPNHWILGMAIGVWVDEQDNVWIIHRSSATLAPKEKGAEQNPPFSECCRGAPPVLRFDPAGNLVGSWGGPGEGYEWPGSNHGIIVDHKGNVWIGGNGPKDAHILKFTKDGKFLMQMGALGKNAGSNDPNNFGRVAKIWIDAKANEAYIADGYLNKRVAVLDADTGKMKRYWGAYGNKPDDTNLGPYDPKAPVAQQFRNPVHCADVSHDGLVYVCDRPNNRLQVFKTDGTFVKEAFYARNTLGDGSTWDVAFSKDPQQRFLFLLDGQTNKVRILLRETLEELTNFGEGGRQAGQFYGVHSVAIDSKGNLYTTETYEGKRLQKFVYKGIGNVPRTQGVLWPKK